MDITYIPMARGFVYLAAVVDWFSRRVLSHRVSITMEADFCVEALEEALAKYGRPEIFNTDQGSQFTGAAFTDVLLKAGVAISMDGKALARQCLCRKALAIRQVRGGLSQGLQDGDGGPAPRSPVIFASTIPADPIRALTGRRQTGLFQPAAADRGALNLVGIPLIKPDTLFRQAEPALSDAAS